MRPPSIALIGAPNVGKSTLFNRLTRGRRALVHAKPGMTRDRQVRAAEIEGRAVEFIDTGGIVPESGEDLTRQISRQALLAAAEADLILLVVDGRLGLTPVDRELASRARRLGKENLLVVVNKLDTPALEVATAEFHALGIEAVVAVSAAHGLGMGDLAEAVLSRLPAPTASGEDPEGEIAVALVGRPNVGKSSLLNRLLREDRFLVSPLPGTTRDAVDTVLRAHGRRFRLVDTAGLRRRQQAADAAENLAIQQARSTLARAHVAVLVMDASMGITAGDLAVAGAALAAGRAVVPVLNKWDLVADRASEATRFRKEAADRLKFIPHGRLLTVSALSGQRARRLLTESMITYDQFAAQVATPVWNRALREAVLLRRPPVMDGKPFRFYYVVQCGSKPPTLEIFVNSARHLPDDYRRFLENQLRQRTGLHRTPLHLGFQTRRPPRA